MCNAVNRMWFSRFTKDCLDNIALEFNNFRRSELDVDESWPQLTCLLIENQLHLLPASQQNGMFCI